MTDLKTTEDEIAQLVTKVTDLVAEVETDKGILDTAVENTTSVASEASSAKLAVNTIKDQIAAAKDEAVAVKDKATTITFNKEQSLIPTADKIPLADANGKISYKWIRPINIPEPDFHLPLRRDLYIKRGKGTPVKMDISPNQDGSKLIDVPNLYQADFTRDSEATYMDRGVLKKAKVNEPRFETDINGNPLGILIEGSSTNLIRYSSLMTDWNNLLSTGRPVITRNIPDFMGGNNAIRVMSSKNNNDFFGIGSAGLIDEAKRTFSIWVKSYNDKNVEFKLFMASSIGSSKSPIFTAEKDWKRISYTLDTQNREQYAVVLENKPLDVGIEIFAPQVEELPFASSYIPTNGGAVTRDDDKLYIEAKNLPQNLESDCTINLSVHVLTVEKIPFWTHYFSSSDGSGSFGYGYFGGQGSINVYGVQKYPCLLIKPDNNINPMTFSVIKSKNVKTFKNILHVETIDSDNFIAFPKEKIILGSHVSDVKRKLWGHIKDFKIWNRALTDEQIYFLGGEDND